MAETWNKLTMQIRKITAGYVTQIFEGGVCIHQSFTAGDDVSFEQEDQSKVDGTQLPYQPFDMVQPNHSITIHVEGGCVQEVDGLPDSWTYTLDDKDCPNEEGEDFCEVCGHPDSVVGTLNSNASHRKICDECAEKGPN